MAKFGCPDKFITMVSQFHNGMLACVINNGDMSAAFPVNNGVKQCCLLAPTLFSMVFTVVLSDAFSNDGIGVRIRYRTDGKLFNLRWLQAKTKVDEDTVRKLPFTDDCALSAESEAQMQESMNCSSAA